MTIRMLSADDKHAEIKRLYYSATRHTIQQDLDKAIGLLKSMANEDERDRAAVYMDGLTQMRSEWARAEKAKSRNAPGRSATTPKRPTTAKPKTTPKPRPR